MKAFFLILGVTLSGAVACNSETQVIGKTNWAGGDTGPVLEPGKNAGFVPICDSKKKSLINCDGNVPFDLPDPDNGDDGDTAQFLPLMGFTQTKVDTEFEGVNVSYYKCTVPNPTPGLKALVCRANAPEDAHQGCNRGQAIDWNDNNVTQCADFVGESANNMKHLSGNVSDSPSAAHTFTGSYFKNVEFSNTKIGKLTGSMLWNVKIGANVVFHNVDGGNPYHPTFSYGRIIASDFGNTTIEAGEFKRAIISFSKFENANIERGRLEDSYFSGVNFKNANLLRAVFSRSRFETFPFGFPVKTTFESANLKGANFRDAHFGPGTVLKEADLSKTIDGVRSIFTGAYIDISVDLTGANFKDAKMCNLGGVGMKTYPYPGNANKPFQGAIFSQEEDLPDYMKADCQNVANKVSCYESTHKVVILDDPENDDPINCVKGTDGPIEDI